MKYQAVQIRVPMNMYEVIRQSADDQGRSVNRQIIFWLENGGIPEALLDQVKADLYQEAEK